jgi:hypothetical protein
MKKLDNLNPVATYENPKLSKKHIMHRRRRRK